MAGRLESKFTLEEGVVYLTGIQALVRLPLDQMRRDRRAGLRTGAFISGYEGSPLGGYDLALARAGRVLADHNVHFRPGLNEDLAATSIFGSQILHVLGESKYDGIVGIWYGKGPGVDRSGDIFRHANLAGTGPNSAALVLGGDDHISKSSSAPHQSDFSFFNVAMPIFCPGNTQEILDYGLLAIALSRFAGCWSAMKLVTDVCDGGGTVEVDPDRPSIRLPENYRKHYDARLVIPYSVAMEPELARRLDAARAFARINGVNRIEGAVNNATFGIASAGKPYYDLLQALADLGIHRDELGAMGVRIAKFGMTYPLDRDFVREFAAGLDTLLVVEEKRSFLELQLRDALYNEPRRPVIIGKQDAEGHPLLPETGQLDPEIIARVLHRYFARGADRLRVVDEIEARGRSAANYRPPVFCAGCPHSRSTILPPGQISGSGIGCHGMAMIGPAAQDYSFLTHMGGDGAPWIGMAPFSERRHVFQNIGDGTYFHSGSLAVQAAIAAGVNITYKILYNGAVAMTGGQAATGALTVPALTHKLEAEGVRRTVVLTDDLAKYEGPSLAANARLGDRDTLPETMRELAQIDGVTVIIYDQQCAAEKRRLRGRGKLAEPTIRLMIHEEVCEGCGDCVKQSGGCVSLHPVETPLGEKRRIHQSSCNKDYSCALGDCPSFITVKIREGTGLRPKPRPPLTPVAEPAIPRAGTGYAILAPGIGGTGVVTINAILATAAWIDGLSVITLDQTGLAQKGGAVVSSIVLSETPIEAPAKIGYANADVLLGFDVLGAAAADNLKRAHPDRTVAIINTTAAPTVASIRSLGCADESEAVDWINRCTRHPDNLFIDAGRMAEEYFGSHLAANMILLGAAWQAGRIPISRAAIEEAIRLNGVAADRNLEAFSLGRAGAPAAKQPIAQTPDYAARLEQYQSKAYAQEYETFVASVAERSPALAPVVARYLYKLMAYKDEYEVARLLTHYDVTGTWEAVERVSYNLHPPLLRALGLKKKIQVGRWFGVLAKLKFLRGTWADPFGYAKVRREERALIPWYRNLIDRLLKEKPDNAEEIASLPDGIRGYEQIKLASIRRVKSEVDQKLRPIVFSA